MLPDHHLLVFGASGRAAAFSALRAGFRPWCADLFADADLAACCPVTSVPSANYPRAFVQISERGPPGSWLYTGALENHPGLISRMAKRRALWGNDSSALRLVRSPGRVRELLLAARLPCPSVCLSDDPLPEAGRWLVKPFGGASGAGIQEWRKGRLGRHPRRAYLQEFIDGESCAAIYVGEGKNARLLGVTRQLVGADWLHAPPFAYCGSVGPLPLPPALRLALDRLGNALVAGAALRGVFGVDFILNGDVPWPVEINPRYTASVEVLELAQGISALSLHAEAFGSALDVGGRAGPGEERGTMPGVMGKAILFARETIEFPDAGPWQDSIERWRSAGKKPIWSVPDLADIPHGGQRIESGRPVFTFFARADNVSACVDRLREIAGGLDHWPWKS